MKRWAQRLLNWLSWDRLRGFSQLGIVRLTVLVPVLGYLIIFNTDLQASLRLTIDPIGSGLWRLHALYYGLSFLAFGTMIFHWRCPELVKLHGSASVFVEREADTINEHRRVNYVIEMFDRRQLPFDRDLPGLREDPRPFLRWMNNSTPDMADGLRHTIRNTFEIGDDHVRGATADRVGLLLARWSENRELLTDYFVPLKHVRSLARVFVGVLYALAGVLLALPTADVFCRVTGHVIRAWL